MTTESFQTTTMSLETTTMSLQTTTMSFRTASTSVEMTTLSILSLDRLDRPCLSESFTSRNQTETVDFLHVPTFCRPAGFTVSDGLTDYRGSIRNCLAMERKSVFGLGRAW